MPRLRRVPVVTVFDEDPHAVDLAALRIVIINADSAVHLSADEVETIARAIVRAGFTRNRRDNP